MATEINGRVGPVVASDGSLGTPRLSNDLATVVQEAHGRYYEACLQGNVWSLATATAGVTVATANTIGQAAGSPLVGLYNPIGSGVNISVTSAHIIVVSGTFTTTTGAFCWGAVAPNAGVTAGGSNGAVNNGSFFSGSSIAKTFSNSAMTGAGASVLLKYIGGITVGAIAANQSLFFTDDVQGDIICPPGGVVGVYAVGVGSTPQVVLASMTWEEVTQP